MDIEIRTAEPADGIPCRRIRKEAYALVRSVYRPRPQAQPFAAGDAGAGSVIALVAVPRSGGDPIGALDLRIVGRDAFIGAIAVAPSCQRRGICRKLIDAAAAAASAAGCDQLIADAIVETGNPGIYVRLGFLAGETTVADWATAPDGGLVHQQRLMRLLR